MSPAMPRIPRTLYREEHEAYRDMVRRFIAAEVTPYLPQWEEEGLTPRSVWRKAGAAGILGATVPEAYGGSGGDFLFDAVLLEELGRAGASAPAWDLHAHIVAPYLLRYGSEAQKRAWLPKMCAGEAIASIGMTEPDAGSDLQRMRTTAVRQGDHYVVNGSKTFITNGIIGDLVLLAVKTAPEAGARGISLLLVDTKTPGYRKGRNLKKAGNKAQDTAELFFDDMRVPVAARLGEEHDGWRMLMSELVQERLIVAVRALATCAAALERTLAHVKARSAFGKPVFDYQNTRFRLADVATEVEVGQVFVDRCVELHARGALDMVTAAMAKVWTTELQDRVLDTCLQLHGGYGYMWEYPIARAWADARVHRIYAGTNEIMREIIGRQL